MARKSNPSVLQGWQQIARYLGQPVATIQRWRKSGMPITRQGRYVTANPEDLQRWLGRESGAAAPVHISTPASDLLSDLKLGLAEARRRRKIHRVK